MKTVVSALKHARGQPVIQSARHFATLLALLVMPNAWAGNASELLNDMKEAYAHKVSTGYARDSRLAGEAKKRELLAAHRGDKEAEARARLVLELARHRIENYRNLVASHYLAKLAELSGVSDDAAAVVRKEYEERLQLLEKLRVKHEPAAVGGPQAAKAAVPLPAVGPQPKGQALAVPPPAGPVLAVRQAIGGGGVQRVNGVIEENVIESRIDDWFEGWNGDTVVKLQNGQVWIQTDFQLRITIRLSPKVLVFNDGFGYKMQVEGTGKTVRVRRLR